MAPKSLPVIPGGSNEQEVYVTFNPRLSGSGLKQRNIFLITWSKSRPIPNSEASTRCGCTAGQKKYVEDGAKRVSLEDLRRVFGLESIKDAEGNVIKEAPLTVWANFQQRALAIAIAEVNAKTDLKIKLASVERSKHRRVVALNFLIKTQAVPKARPN